VFQKIEEEPRTSTGKTLKKDAEKQAFLRPYFRAFASILPQLGLVNTFLKTLPLPQIGLR